jgi:putative zinc finger/helix-turn-helix YgiT family protein
MSSTCPSCGTRLRHRHGIFTYEWPANLHHAASHFDEAEWEECSHCGEIVIPPALNKRIENEQYAIEGLLTPVEIRVIRDRTGLTQVEMARLINAGDKTYARWEAGLSMQTKSMDSLIRTVAEDPSLIMQVNAQRDPDRHEVVAQYVRQLPRLKARNEYPMAAHGGELTAEIIVQLRQRLLEIIQEREDETDEA